jgi:hypothetical protein
MAEELPFYLTGGMSFDECGFADVLTSRFRCSQAQGAGCTLLDAVMVEALQAASSLPTFISWQIEQNGVRM